MDNEKINNDDSLKMDSEELELKSDIEDLEKTLKINYDEFIEENKVEEIDNINKKNDIEKRKINKKTIIFLVIGIVLVISLVLVFIFLNNKKLPDKKPSEILTKEECNKYKYHWWEDKKVCVENKLAEDIDNEEECNEFGYNWWYKQKVCSTEEAKITIVDQESKTRPIAVMINNHAQARPYHSGLQDANIVYEMIVEGGITRMMAIFKDKDTARIGSVRSSRHYFLDYALENDAIYVHFGWSPQAESDISSLKINNINGLYDSAFTRDTSLPVDYEHTAITSMDSIKSVANSKGYRVDYNSDDVLNEQVLKYSTKRIDLSGSDDSIVANNVSVTYSYYMTSSYKYDKENEYYLRFANDTAHTDYITKEQYHFKNIIIINVKNYSIDSYGRQGLDNIGTGSGYFITNGYARPITWEKTSREAKTKYKYQDGTEITVNDDNTFIQIVPISSEAEITE